MKKIAICQRKGGNHKTTVAFNLAYYLAISGKTVLLLDLDSQCNITGLFTGAGASPVDYDTWKILPVFPVAKNISLLPGTKSFERLKGEIQERFERRTFLKEYLKPVNEYDCLIIDTAPSLDILTINALVACDTVVVPVNPGKFSLNGLSEMLYMIEQVRSINPNLCTRILLSGYHRGRTVSETVLEQLKTQFNGSFCDVVIPYREHVEQAMLRNRPAIDLEEIYNEYKKLEAVV